MSVDENFRVVFRFEDRHAPVSADLAIRLARALGTEPEIWVNMQAQYDLWEAAQKAPPKVKVLSAA